VVLDVPIAPSLLDSATALHFPSPNASWVSYIITASEEVTLLLEVCASIFDFDTASRFDGVMGQSAHKFGRFRPLFRRFYGCLLVGVLCMSQAAGGSVRSGMIAVPSVHVWFVHSQSFQNRRCQGAQTTIAIKHLRAHATSKRVLVLASR
jgi:hypothetical protein